MKISMSRLAILASSLSLASARKCMNLTVEVTVDARNSVFNLTAPASDIDVTDFILNSSQVGQNSTKRYFTGEVSGQFLHPLCVATSELTIIYCSLPPSRTRTTSLRPTASLILALLVLSSC